MIVYAYACKPPTGNAEIVREQLRLAHVYRNKLVEIEKARRLDREAAGQDDKLLEAVEETSRASIRAARAASGVYWGTYLLIEDAAQRSRRTGKEPKFRRWEGEGAVAAQIQKGMPTGDLLAGTDRRARITGEGKHRTLHLRVGTEPDGRSPIWATWPMVYHRELPDGPVKWVKVVCRRVGSKVEYEAQISIDVDGVLPEPVRGSVAIDVGWRRREDGVRVAYLVDDEGRELDVKLPPLLERRTRKTDDLRSIRDKNFAAARDALRDWLGSRLLPLWLAEATKALWQWKSPARLASVALHWRAARFPGDEMAFDALEAWRHQDKHLLEWEANQRQNVLRSRREIYRRLAKDVAKYRRVVIEDLDLRQFAEVPEGDEDPRTTSSRPRRYRAALSELRAAIRGAVKRAGGELLEVEAAWTTQTCSICTEREVFDAAGSVEHTCSHCGATWDQDANAARNLLRAARDGTPHRDRSRRTSPSGPNPAAERRKKGLETRRARHSKSIGQVNETATEI